MYTTKLRPGKFEGNRSQLLAQVIYQASLDGANDELGDTDGFGFYALVQGKRYAFILCEDTQGFVSVQYGDKSKMMRMWAELETEYYDWVERYGDVID
ncbi:MAG: hypothetical protein ACRCZI_11415 [Cetobacterium sp.]